ncbi:50S ribosomal protein L23 [Psychrobacter sanguinis]|uniref:50S ribosomal protein L23 n=1 Tax=Psychrobacter sanguinis TaxID=861445 RepID=UPI00020C93AF|nr:50S ribosomal protein L23 [Psychrobacter sanguinis]EGK14428.1 50S ribosomal protein L23 [Psychrobacter sp. 1501(2011)]MCD9150728.1 50S ribosomal protein L23 [Psychrobacter sanguinis]HBH34137.1 50S ribosomal protein L23 [Psychrobacter sp.]
MNNARLYQVLKGPVFSEKSQLLGDSLGVQVFKVDNNATKREIKKAVELMFEGVEVTKVNTLNVKGKTKRFGRTVGRRNDYKKAYVTLKAGQDVQMADAGEEVADTAATTTSETANNE